MKAPSPPDAPADTRMMAIVHSALKRDLARAREVLAGPSAPGDRQRVAIARHVTWMLDFLHSHHSGEDAGMWPLVRRRDPGAADLLDSMEADHARIAPKAEAAAAAAQAYGATSSEGARVSLVEALDGLLDVLVPHLDREVAEAMPVVSACLTRGEWDEVEQEFFVKNKSKRELAMEGHWLIEGIDPEGYDIVVHTVPPLLRFVLVHGFGPAYRRRAKARWGAAS